VQTYLGVFMDGLHAPSIDQRPHVGARLKTVADAQRLSSSSQLLRERFLHGFMYDHAARRGAALAGRAEGTQGNATHRKIHVGVIHHDNGILAAQFQGATAQVAPTDLRDAPPNLGRTGQRDHIHAPMARQRVAQHTTGTRQHVQHTGGQASLIEQLSQFDREQRRIAGRFEHDSVASQ
jgi:hypothetical protein